MTAVVPEPGMPRGEQRYKGTAAGRVVAGLGRRQTNEAALAELLFVFRFGQPLFHSIGEKRTQGGAGAGQRPDEKTQQRAASQRRGDLFELLAGHLEIADAGQVFGFEDTRACPAF